jgi:hypothetical protein
VRRAVGWVVVLLVLLLVVDRGADWTAERVLAGQVQQRADLPEPPDVDIAGFPFLTQVASGRYEAVRLDIRNPIVVGGTRIDRSSAVTRGVRLPFPDLVNRDLDALRVRRTKVTAQVPFAQLERLVNDGLEGSDLRLRLSQAANGQALLAGRVSTPLGSVGLRAPAKVTIQEGRLRLTIPAGALQRLPALARDVVSTVLGRSFELPRLPEGFRVTSVAVVDDGVTVRAVSDRSRLGFLRGT